MNSFFTYFSLALTDHGLDDLFYPIRERSKAKPKKQTQDYFRHSIENYFNEKEIKVNNLATHVNKKF